MSASLVEHYLTAYTSDIQSTFVHATYVLTNCHLIPFTQC